MHWQFGQGRKETLDTAEALHENFRGCVMRRAMVLPFGSNVFPEDHDGVDHMKPQDWS